ncbi:chemotaxis protein CheB [Hymenobacter wooponensis]|uniref:chemotaxis protein CheB n=1 Tax=Hymenobacter wooponensis TaxID=1525360 RepID=UPI00143693A8|nr:chemotaxis protein CheB [Hymenobacter wooponensis]
MSTHKAPTERFPIVGLGGSAGSLEALELFFVNLPSRTGAAFVVVTHLGPQQSELAKVLQSFTPLLVQEATDGMRVRPDHVYVIPPSHELSLLHGNLLLLAPTQPQSSRLPIDFFFQSLAKDAQDRAVCIILSGLGSDGTIGLKMVMENFGMVMVQQPDTALFDSMPRSAIATEFVDFVLPPEDMPTKLLEYIERPLVTRPPRELSPESKSKPAHALQKIFMLIRGQTGHDFTYYKRNTLFRRIERRMNSHQIKEFTHYVRYLQEHPQEVDLLFKELLIGVTKFFRDQEAYESLRSQLIPVLIKKPADSTVRVWAPGASTGEEAYSLAMLLQECLDHVDPHKYLKIQIFATDINPEGIDYARLGLYPENIAGDVSPERLRRFFHKVDGGYQIRKEVRDVVVVALHNLSKDAPFTKLDLLCCRNLLIYLSSDLQRNLLPIFHYSLNPGGLLFLGPSENVTGFQDLFIPLDIKWKISRRSESVASLTRLANFPFSLTRHPAAPAHPVGIMNASTPRRESGAFATLVQKVLLRYYAPPAVVINGKGDILFVNGRTGKYLEPAPGLSGMNLFDMAREELNFEISGAVHRATQSRQDAVLEEVRLKTETGYEMLRLTVKYLAEPDTLAGLLMVVFEDLSQPKRNPRRKKMSDQEPDGRDAVVVALEKELKYTKYRLQTTIEEMESSVEELKSTNEELQSANEELQSTNEEAMTNKEEMQSLNEELMTLNMQYLSKTDELSQAANDMKNLLDSTELAIIFLDNEMVIKRFTPPVARIINLLPTDVGRPIMHFANNLQHTTLADDVQLVLNRLLTLESSIQTKNGEWYVMRILPYRTLDNYISGAVITFTEVTGMKRLEQELQESARFAESIIETVREPLLALDRDLRVLTVSKAFSTLFRVDGETIKGESINTFGGGAWSQPDLHRRLLKLLNNEAREFDNLEMEADFPEIGHQRVRLYGRRISSQGSKTDRILLSVEVL